MKKRFELFRRGQIVLVNFEPQVGYEIKGLHYAIVVTKKDQPYIGTVTVIPLTSKKGNHLLCLNDCIHSALFKEIEKERKKFVELKNSNLCKEKIDDLIRLRTKYSDLQRTSYANLHQITTVDKSKVKIPFYDDKLIKPIKVSVEILDMIDEELIRLYIGKKY
jgi:mRNA-degrading endonuclease toxin of MazEF toxin-antitoxin module